MAYLEYWEQEDTCVGFILYTEYILLIEVAREIHVTVNWFYNLATGNVCRARQILC